jgi:excinuclease ABC subunit C
LEQPPRSIGAFDISNITATAPVGAFIYWEDGTLRKEYYRHVRMDAVRGPDDYGMMREMVGRTIASVGDNLPDLVIIDGGREHLETALDVFRERGIRDRKVIGVAKDPDRVFLEGRKTPIMIGDGSASSLLLRKLRDEAHRFAIHYHRKLRAQRTFASALDKIYGLGQKRRFALLSSFGSIEAVKNASAEEIARVKGFSNKLAEEVLHSLKKQGSA